METRGGSGQGKVWRGGERRGDLEEITLRGMITASGLLIIR